MDISQVFDHTKRNNAFDEAYDNPIYKNAVASWLPFLDKRGYLDVFLPETPLTPFLQSVMSQMPKVDETENEKTKKVVISSIVREDSSFSASLSQSVE